MYRYEEEVTRLRHELESRGVPSHVGGPFHTAQLPPPSVGNGPSNLFGGITAGGAAPGGPGLAPPGSRGGRNPRSSPSPATPQQYSAAPYPRSPQVHRSGTFGGQEDNQLALQAPPDTLNVGNSLGEFDPNRLPPHLKRDGSDWLAVFNPKVQRILDVDLVHTLNHTSIVCYVRFSFDGRFIATGCNRSAEIFDVDTGNCVAVLQDTSLPEDGDIYIRSVCFSPDGKYLVTGGEDKIINVSVTKTTKIEARVLTLCKVWEIQSRTIKHQFTGHEQDIYSLDFARNGRLIASGSGDRTVRLWDIETNQQVILLLIDDGVTAVAISSDNRYVAAGSLDKSVRVWDVSTGFLVQRLEGEFGHIDSVYSVAFAPNGNTLVSGSLDKTIKIWELEPPPSRLMTGQGPRGGKCIKTFEGHKVSGIDASPGGSRVLILYYRTLC